jgi:cell division ATPase FtsA
MRKAMKFALLGGLVGAGWAGYKALKQDETIEGVAKRVATVGGEAAAGGLVVGFVLDRRSRRRTRRRAVKTSKLAGMAIAAKPAFDAAVELATHAAEAAKPKVEHAAEVAKPKVERAAKKAKVKAAEMAEAARPRVVDLTDRVSEKMASLRDEVAAASST